MFLVPATGLYEDETLGTFGLLLAQPFTLSVFDRKGVGVPVHVFERGKDFTHVLFYGLVKRSDLVKARERQDDGIRRGRHHWGKNRDTSYNSESTFSADEYLLQVVS